MKGRVCSGLVRSWLGHFIGDEAGGSLKIRVREFPGGPAVRTWRFHCRSLGSIPGRVLSSCKPCGPGFLRPKSKQIQGGKGPERGPDSKQRPQNASSQFPLQMARWEYESAVRWWSRQNNDPQTCPHQIPGTRRYVTLHGEGILLV